MKSFDALKNWHAEFVEKVYYAISIFLILLICVICLIGLRPWPSYNFSIDNSK